MVRSISIAIVAALGLGALAAPLVTAAWHADRSGIAAARPNWAEMQWPFPIDEWGNGRAVQCRAADCGSEVKFYVRAKIGVCNCVTGVADDAELERLSDFALIDGRVAALGDGRPIEVAWMKGRSRPYQVFGAGRGGKSALSVAFNDGCDAIVASAVIDGDKLDAIEPRVIEFLNGQTVVQWAKITLGQ